MFLAVTSNRERTYVARVDRETCEVVLVAYNGSPPNLSEEITLEERFTTEEAFDLERALRDTRERADDLRRAREVQLRVEREI